MTNSLSRDSHSLRGPHPHSLAPAPIDPSDNGSSNDDDDDQQQQQQQNKASTVNPTQGHGHGPKDVLQKILLAGVSNQVAACVTNPMDLVKVRQQLESSAMRAAAAASASSSAASTTTTVPNLATATATATLNTNAATSTTVRTGLARGTTTPWYQVMARMIKQEGPGSVYKGLSASLVREATYSGIRMGAYDGCKALVTLTFGTSSSPESFGTKLFAGMLSGMLGSAVANPADLLKVRMQASGAQGRLRDHARDIVNERGFKGLYRAIGPTMVRAGILTSSQLGVYDHAKHTLMDDFPNVFREGFATHFAASGVAGFVCSATSSPVDVVKVRMMSSEGGKYRNALHCTAVILKNEGPLAFYKGFTMCFLRLWPHSVLSLLFFENLRRLAGVKPI
ncbi:hypothetical protein ACM66B_002453 [Microbotryomycetes sp. NB124-2]